MPAGSVNFYLGQLWHGGGANHTDRPRLGVILEYVASWLRAQETHLLAVPPEVVATLPERAPGAPRLQHLPAVPRLRGRPPPPALAPRTGIRAPLTVPMDDRLRAALETTLGARIRRADRGARRRRGGRVPPRPRRRAAPVREDAPVTAAGFFTTEASGLRWLGEAAGGAACPAVVAVADEEPAHLVLEWIDEGRPNAEHRRRLRRRPGRPAPVRRAVLRAGGPPHHRQPRATQRAGDDVGRVLRPESPDPAGQAGARRRRAAGRRRSPVWRRWPGGWSCSAPPTSHRPASTATCGPATAWSTRTGAAGSSTRPPTAATASSTSP